eukprot:gene31882-38548_t
MATIKGKTVTVPKDPHFSHPEHKADEWDVDTVCKFFEEKLDFPQYQEDIKQLYLNGQSFISLHEEVPFSGFKVAHPLHKIKIMSHAERLRNLVLEQSAKHEGKQVKHFSAADTAAYLLKNPEVPKITAVLALRHNWCAKNLEKVSKDPKTQSKLAPLSEKDSSIVVGALCKLVEDNPDLIEKKPEPTAKETGTQPKTAVPTVVEKKTASDLAVPPSNKEIKPKPLQPGKPVSKPVESVPLPPPEPPIDLSAFEADRQQFMKRISSLEQTLSHHVDDMMKLKQKAEKLEQERELLKAQQAQVSSNSKVAQKIIDSLVQDRQFVTKELEKITHMYYSQLEREKGEVQEKIERLSTDILQSKKQTLKTQEPVSIKIPTMAPTEEFFGGRATPGSTYRGGMVPDDDSDLDSVVEHVLSSSSKGNLMQRDNDQSETLLASYDSRSATGQDPTTNSAAVRQSHSGSVGIADTRPREGGEVNRVLFSDDARGKEQVALPANAPSTRTLNMAQYVQSNVQKEIDFWQKVLKKYKITGDNAATAADSPLVLTHAIGDTRQILLEMASKWMSLGRAICTQVLSKDNVEEGLQAALTGIRRCSLKAIEAQYPALFPELFPSKDASKGKTKPDKNKMPPRGNMVAMEATFNTFMLAIVTRLFTRFSKNEDRTQLMFLLNQAQAGELPMSEVSRENFREFMHHQIEMELPWDKFDAAMQRIDVNKSGFITSQEVFSALLKLTPLSERLKSPLGQQVTQLLLTICNDGLVQYHHKMQAQKNDKTTTSAAKGSTLSQTWLHLLLARQGSSASFQKYVDTLYSNANSDKAVRETMANLNFMSEKELRQFLESKWVEDQLFVSDILYELSREFVSRAQSVVMDQPQKKYFFSKNKASAALEYIISNQQEACSLVAKSLNFYNNLYRNMTADSGRDVLQELSNFVLDFTEYRVRVLEFTARNTNIGLNKEMINILTGKSEQLEQWLLVAVDHPTKLYRGNDNTGSLDIKIVEDWRVAELMSIFIPYPSQPEKDASDMTMPCFSSVQSLLELCLAQSVDGMEKYVNEKQHKYADSEALHEVQQEIYKSLWQHNTVTVKPNTLKNTKVPLAGHLVDTINDFNHQQRVDQVTAYLEILNNRAISKKKMLQ